MTSLVFALSHALARTWKPGDEVIVTSLDHDANVAPWLLAARDAGATVRTWEVRIDDCTLRLADLEALLNERTRLVAFTHASNAVGTIPDVGGAIRLARAKSPERWCASTPSIMHPTGRSMCSNWIAISSLAQPTSFAVRTSGSCTGSSLIWRGWKRTRSVRRRTVRPANGKRARRASRASRVCARVWLTSRKWRARMAACTPRWTPSRNTSLG